MARQRAYREEAEDPARRRQIIKEYVERRLPPGQEVLLRSPAPGWAHRLLFGEEPLPTRQFVPTVPLASSGAEKPLLVWAKLTRLEYRGLGLRRQSALRHRFLYETDPVYRQRKIEAALARRRTTGGAKPRRWLRAIVKEQDGICRLCGGRLPETLRHIHVDHIVPASRGGSDERSNLQAVHWRCNLVKGNRLEGSP